FAHTVTGIDSIITDIVLSHLTCSFRRCLIEQAGPGFYSTFDTTYQLLVMHREETKELFSVLISASHERIEKHRFHDIARRIIALPKGLNMKFTSLFVSFV